MIREGFQGEEGSSMSNTQLERNPNYHSTQFSSSLNCEKNFFKRLTHDSYESMISNTINSRRDDKSTSSLNSARTMQQPKQNMYSSMVNPQRHYSAFQSGQLASFNEQTKEFKKLLFSIKHKEEELSKLRDQYAQLKANSYEKTRFNQEKKEHYALTVRSNAEVKKMICTAILYH